MAERTGGKRVQALFNTDWHAEHTGSNETLGKAGATIIAHEHTKQYLGAEIFVDWQNRTYKPLPPQALPNQTFYTSGKMTASAPERIEYGHLGQAHTDGEIYVFFPASNVLVAGDVLSVGKYPIAGLHHRRLAGRTGRRRTRPCSTWRTPRRASCPAAGRFRRAPTCRRSTTCSPR